VAALFVAGFLITGSAVTRLLSVLTFLQFVPSFIQGVLAGVGIAAFGWILVLAVTLVFGRVYCSSICPLGTVQDALIRLFRRRRFVYRQPLSQLRYGVLAAVVLTAVAGTMILVDLLGPYALFGRMFHDLAFPLVALGSRGVTWLLRAVSVYTAPIVYPLNPGLMAVTAVLFILLAFAAAKDGRFFCNRLCPVGAVLGLPARFSLLRIRIDSGTCTSCGLCEAVCKAGCMDSQGKKLDASRCVSCFNCLNLCPVDAISYAPALPWGQRRSAAPTEQPAEAGGRRQFLRQSLGAATALSVFPLGGFFRKRGTAPDGSPNRPATPPGSRSVAHFTSHCIACHLCVNRCPTHVLQPSLAEYGLEGFMQPVMDYGRGFCEYQCNDCSQICPTGAILPVTLAEKQRIQIGTATFLRDRCVVITQGTACGACAEVCPTHAVHMVPYRDHLTLPETDPPVCIGCGNCEYACPVEGGKAIYVTGKAEHTVIEERRPVAQTEGWEAPEDTGDEPEFPF